MAEEMVFEATKPQGWLWSYVEFIERRPLKFLFVQFLIFILMIYYAIIVLRYIFLLAENIRVITAYPQWKSRIPIGWNG